MTPPPLKVRLRLPVLLPSAAPEALKATVSGESASRGVSTPSKPTQPSLGTLTPESSSGVVSKDDAPSLQIPAFLRR